MNILIAEDDPMLLKMTALFLQAFDYRYALAANGQEAVELAEKHDFDLCLMDIDMPVMDGYQASQYIRKHLKYIPILALSGAYNLKSKYLNAGMDDYLKKPYNINDLNDKIKALTVKAVILHKQQNMVTVIKEKPMNPEELKELQELKKQGLTKLKLIGTDYTFIVHKNIQNKISHDLVGEGKEISEFIDRSQTEPGRCHLYKANLHVTKDLFTPEELAAEMEKENHFAAQFNTISDMKAAEDPGSKPYGKG